MQRRDKQDVVTALDLIGLLALQLPVGIVDQDQDTRAAVFLFSTVSAVTVARGGRREGGGVAIAGQYDPGGGGRSRGEKVVR